MTKILLICILVLIPLVYSADPGYHVIKKEQLGGDGSWDYLIVDNAARRLNVDQGKQYDLILDLIAHSLLFAYQRVLQPNGTYFFVAEVPSLSYSSHCSWDHRLNKLR